jgi:hypothetical protein
MAGFLPDLVAGWSKLGTKREIIWRQAADQPACCSWMVIAPTVSVSVNIHT